MDSLVGLDEVLVLDFGRSTGTSMDIFVRGVGVGFNHTKNLMIKKLKSGRETGELETEEENALKKSPFRRVFESYFDLTNHYSNNVVVMDSDFKFTERTCAIAITADVRFKAAQAADFQREYKSIEFLWKQRPDVGGMTALPPVASQIAGKYLCFLETKATDKQHVNPKNLVLALTNRASGAAEEDRDCPEQTEVDKGVQPDFPLTMETRQSKRGKGKKKYNPYGDDSVTDMIIFSDMMDSLVGLDEVLVPQEINLVKDTEQDWIDDCSEPEVEFESETEQMHDQKLTSLRVLEWLHDPPADPKETISTIQEFDQNSIKYISHGNTVSNWVAPDNPLHVPESNLDLLNFGRSTGMSMDIFVRGVGVGLTHTKNLMNKN